MAGRNDYLRNTKDEYLRNAKACVAQAQLLLDPQDRAAVLTIAQTYIKLADRMRAQYERGAARDPGDQHPQNHS